MRKIKTNLLIEILVFAFALSLLFYLLISSGVSKPKTFIDNLIFFSGILVILFVTLGIHELGHLVTGLIQGFQFELFVIGPLGIKRENNRIKVYFNKDMTYYGGVAATSPINESARNAKRFSRLIIAGPIASLLFALICISISMLLSGLYESFLFITGLLSLSIFFATTIPTKTGIFFSDRKRFQRLITPGHDQQVEMAMMRIMGRYTQDNAYINVDKNDIEKLIDDKIPFVQYYGAFCSLCYQHELNGKSDFQSEEKYKQLAKEMPKNLVISMDKELEKLKNKITF